MDLDQYIIVPDFRFRHFGETYCALAFVTIDDECPHGLSKRLLGSGPYDTPIAARSQSATNTSCAGDSSQKALARRRLVFNEARLRSLNRSRLTLATELDVLAQACKRARTSIRARANPQKMESTAQSSYSL